MSSPGLLVPDNVSVHSSAASFRSRAPSRLSNLTETTLGDGPSIASLPSPPEAPYSINDTDAYTLAPLGPLPKIGLHNIVEGAAALEAGLVNGLPAASPPRPPPPAVFDPDALAHALYDATNQCSKDIVADILCRRPPDQVAQIAASFDRFYRMRACRYVVSRMGGADRHLVRLLEACAAGFAEYDAARLYKSLHHRTFHHDTVLEILAGRPVAEVLAVRNAYARLHGSDLQTDLFNKLKSPFKDLMTMIVDVECRSPGPFDVHADAVALYAAGAGMPGREDLPIIKRLVDRPVEHIRAVAMHYERQYGHSLIKHLGSEYFGSPDLRRALKLIVRSAVDRTEAVAHMFDKALRVRSLGDIVDMMMARGSGADDGLLIRLVVENRDPATRDAVKRAYMARYGRLLTNRMRGIVKSPDYLNALLLCMGERRSFSEFG